MPAEFDASSFNLFNSSMLGVEIFRREDAEHLPLNLAGLLADPASRHV
jgi:hypothetical protein